VEPADVQTALAEMFTFGQGLPVTKTMTKSTESLFSMLKLRTKIADMVTAYLEKKQEHNVMDYGDLVRYAQLLPPSLTKCASSNVRNTRSYCSTNSKTPRMPSSNSSRTSSGGATEPSSRI